MEIKVTSDMSIIEGNLIYISAFKYKSHSYHRKISNAVNFKLDIWKQGSEF